MKKQSFILAIALTGIFTLTGCGEKTQTPEEKINKELKKFGNLDSLAKELQINEDTTKMTPEEKEKRKRKILKFLTTPIK